MTVPLDTSPPLGAVATTARDLALETLPLVADPDAVLSADAPTRPLGSLSEDLPWRYRVALDPGPAIESIEYRAPDQAPKGQPTLRAFESIGFGEWEFTIAGTLFPLTLTREHLVASFVSRPRPIRAPGGHRSRFWRFPWATGNEEPGSGKGIYLDEGVTLLFVVELRGGRLQALGQEDREALAAGGPIAWKIGGTSTSMAGLTKSKSGKVRRIEINLPRIAVALSFAGASPRVDFEPMGVLGACRFWPHAVVTATVDLERIATSFELARPSATCHGRPLQIYGFADHNDHELWSGGLRPYWDKMFSHYMLNPKDLVLATHDGAQKDFYHADYRQVSEDGGRTWRPSSWWRAPRQGDADSLHMSPLVHWAGGDEYAAPFCVEGPCAHIHLRWGMYAGQLSKHAPPLPILHLTGSPLPVRTAYDLTRGTMHERGDPASHLLGWGPRGPWTEPGLPQVPLGQFVSAAIPEPGVLKINVVQLRARAGHPQVFFHHGGALSHHTTFWTFMARLTGAWPSWTQPPMSWGAFYHAIRFYDLSSTSERLRLPVGAAPFMTGAKPP